MFNFKTRGKLLTIIISIIVLFSVVVNVIVYIQFNSLITNNFLKTNSNLSLQSINNKYPGDWKMDQGKLYKGDVLIDNNVEIVDTIKNDANIECTIFLNDTRIATTIEQEGKRAVGTKADQKVAEEVLQKGNPYMGSAKVLNVPYKTLYVPISDKSDAIIGMFFVGIDRRTIDKEANAVVSDIVLLTVVMMILASVVIVLMTTRIVVKPIRYIEERLKIMAKGDLSSDTQTTYLEKRDEFGEIVRYIREVQNALRSMTGKIKETSGIINDESGNLSAVSEEMASASENVSNTIQEVAKGANSQAEELVRISSILDSFGEQLNGIVQEIQNIDSSSKDINHSVNYSNESIKSLIQSVNMISECFKDFNAKIQVLSQNITKIDEITEFINNIADQTNLLALNAAIEAARAGEGGRGFSVVAEEIRKLAEQSKNSLESINNLVHDVSENTDDMLKNVSMISGELDNQSQVMNTATDSYEKMIEAVNAIGPKIDAVDNLTLDLDKKKDTIIGQIANISSIAQEVSASAEEMAASSEQLNASAEEVASAAQNMNGTVKEMMDEVNRFKL